MKRFTICLAALLYAGFWSLSHAQEATPTVNATAQLPIPTASSNSSPKFEGSLSKVEFVSFNRDTDRLLTVRVFSKGYNQLEYKCYDYEKLTELSFPGKSTPTQVTLEEDNSAGLLKEIYVPVNKRSDKFLIVFSAKKDANISNPFPLYFDVITTPSPSHFNGTVKIPDDEVTTNSMVVKWNLKSVEKPQDNIAINYVLTIKKDGFERKVKGSGQLVDEKKIEGLLPGSSYSIIMEAGEVGKTNTFESSAEVAKTLAQADFTEYPMIAFSDQGMQISFKTNLACQSAIAIRPKGSAGFVQIANGTISNDHTHTITQELEFVSKDGAKVAEIKINLMDPAKSTVVKSMTFYLGGKLANLNGLSKKDKKELAVQAEKVGTVVGAGMKGLLKILVPVVP